MSAARNNSAANSVNMNRLLREINNTRRANRNMNAAAPLNPAAAPFYPAGMNPAAPAWNPPLNPAAAPFYPAGMNPAAAPFVPAEVPDAQVMNAYLREINANRRANMPNQRRRKTRKNRKSRKNRKASRRA
jgi:hypothetical protein